MNIITIRLPGGKKGILLRVYQEGDDFLCESYAGVKVAVIRKNMSPLTRIYYWHELPENKKRIRKDELK